MKIIIDDKIPYIKGVLENTAEVIYKAGKEITESDVLDADALIVRTRTQCNAKLLKNSNVKFIATATIGYDHIDTEFCKEQQIVWKNAPGCNAQSVAEYIASALLYLSNVKNISLEEKTIGIVGVGNVGKKVAEVAKQFKLTILQNDPPREEDEKNSNFVSLDEICKKSDIITFHTPLIREGIYKTYHLADSKFFEDLAKKPIFINAARGEITNTSALKEAIRNGKTSSVVIDCWENEPNIDSELLSLVDLATPHIAGYSADGKANATTQCVQAVSRFFHLGLDNWQVLSIPKPANSEKVSDFISAMNLSYKILDDDFLFRKNPEAFELLRGNYPLRRESKYYLKYEN